MKLTKKERESLIGLPYNPDDARFAKLLDSLTSAGYTQGWKACFREYVEPEAGRALLRAEGETP